MARLLAFPREAEFLTWKQYNIRKEENSSALRRGASQTNQHCFKGKACLNFVQAV
jgi:hypothetical protein